MKGLFKILSEMGASILIFILLILLLFGVSWIITCGIIKLITLCFGLKFSWIISTGIWLCLVLICGTQR